MAKNGAVATKGRRHIKLETVSDVSAKKVAIYLPLALEAARREESTLT